MPDRPEFMPGGFRPGRVKKAARCAQGAKEIEPEQKRKATAKASSGTA